MKRLTLFFVLSFLFAACKKKEDVNKLPEVLTYTIYDSTFTIDGYVNDRDGYRRYHSDSSHPVSYTENVTVDTFSAVKQLIYRSLDLERINNTSTSFMKSGIYPLYGNFIRISLKGDSIFISCEYERWQTEVRSYLLRGIRK